MKPIRFGFVMPGELRDPALRSTYVADVNRALSMIAGHFESAWMVDHLQFDDADVLEGFTSIAYLSALHPALKFGNAVLCQSFRSPALLAKMGATLQLLSGGRFLLGLGACWHEAEHRAYGYDFPSSAVRVEQLEETLQIIQALWTQDTVTFEGKHYQLRAARCEPKPDPIPDIMLGAFKPKMMRLAARYAGDWNVSSTGPVRYGKMVAEFNLACQELGRDPGTVSRSWIGGCACADTQRQAEDLAGDRFQADNEEDFGFVGTPQQVVEQMRSFIDLGVNRFILDCQDFPRTGTLERLLAQVLPEVVGE
jgi:alkanesulfonate monooxygenase SsuD/methylene tetrahydromethanopterin reductase-like flavin-dependent oxidoreductase (luciferase family)